MAAEVPVGDILCEAMEYLAKLGSNLQTRSDSLKEKRISKHKLKNVHAIQKAASKVLLICELSKKSLDNVEKGVRKVLSRLEDSQAPSKTGGETSDSKRMKKKRHYYCFEYKSQILRIAKKIPLKHYMSAKVIATGMPTSMQEKYPVYYDCKLKRQRRRAGSNQKLEDKSNKPHCLSEKKQGSENSDSGEDKDLASLVKNSMGKLKKKKQDNGSHSIGRNKLSISSESQSESEKDDKRLHFKNVENVCDDNTKSVLNDSTNSKNCRRTSTEVLSGDISDNNKHVKSPMVNEKKNKVKVRFANIYSDSEESEKADIAQNVTHSCPNEETKNPESETNNSVNEPETKKTKLSNDDSIIQLDSDCNDNELETEQQNVDRGNSTEDQGLENLETQRNSSQNECSMESKPLIRCVNLSKLLKPDMLSNKNDSTNEGLFKKTTLWSRINNETSRKKRKNKDKKRKENKSDEEEYWTKKRQEVSKFKPKKCTINIERLPNLTISFLYAHHLKKIVEKGNVICERTAETDRLNSTKNNAVKEALLIDSESDDCTNIEADQKEKSFDKGSDSEGNVLKKDESNSSTVTKKKTILKNDVENGMDNQESANNELEEDVDESGNSKIDQNHGNNGQSQAGIPNQTEPDTPTKTIQKVKSSLLCDSSDERVDINEKDTNSLINVIEENLSVLNNKSDEDLSKNANEETPTKINEKIKHSLLNDSSDEQPSINNTPTKTNEKVKSSLLKDSSDEKSDSNKDKSIKVSETEKAKQNDESADVKSDSSGDRQKRRKTPKSKRKRARKCREAKKSIRYSSSSDEEENRKNSSNEEDKHENNRSRKKSMVSSSSSSSSEKRKKKKSTAIDQIDGAFDEQSNSSDTKMVRSKAKPSGSSSQNSDNQDAMDKDIDRITNLNSLNKNRREHATRSKGDSGAKSNRRSQPTPIIGEELLKAESSSDASDHDEHEYEQDLPPVTMPVMNGDSGEHLAKDDLLGESDSSVSHNDKDSSENAENVEETDGEENVKLKRRKANAISSDSDGGTHRRKGDGERMSDFEDSEDESSEPAKKAKRKQKAADSDASDDSNDGGKKKRRRIKQVDSDASGSDTENEGRKHGRKNIRKVMGKNQLEEATKKAAREEKERIARISERQKLYNNLDFDESGKPDEVVLEKVVLDFDPETKEPLIQVDRGLVKKLKPHQANGIKFMWDACFESVKRIKKDKGSGCILAHCMGLGKTLQVISLTHTLLVHGSLTGVNRVLVVCPLSTVLNWVNEIRMWLKHAQSDFDVDVYELSRYKQNSERAFQLQQWLDNGGICVLGYEMFRNLSADNNKKFKKKMLRSFQESLVDPGPDLVVCDEGHLLKNEKTSLSQSMNRVKTLRRIVLTGTPLQNNLKEYYCMVQFVKPNLLGKYNEYLNRFVNPITNGQYTDSTEHDIRVMKRRSHVLHKMLDGAVQRRDYGVLAPFLPPKHEYVLFITLTEVQVKLYQFYLDNYSRRPSPGKSSGFLFPDFQSLQRIWTHPLVLKYNSERYEIMQQKKRDKEEEDSEGSLVDFIDDDSTPEESSTEESSDDLSDTSDDSRKKNKKKKSAKKGKGKESKGSARRGTRANPIDVDDDDHDVEEVVEVKNENPTEWWIKLVEETELDDMRNSSKLVLLFDILRQCETIGDKLLVFSQSLYSLDLIEHFLGKVDEATQEGRIDEKLGGHVGSWSPGIDYFRLDGSTSCENRSIWCKNFNKEDNPRARLFLISTRAGGLGINLVAANRVVIFDVSWNPSHDVQSIFRVYRFGQKKPCYVYRFLAMGTMEEKIYERQVTKQAISKRVIDEQQIDRHYAENDLAELYKFEARPDEPRPLPTLPKDRLFAEMLKEHEAQIYKYHEHDSLLENKEEETLSEEERKAAWEDFENEKNKPPPAPFPSAWPMHNGMVPGLLAQQQQQLAYAALAAMLRKDMPNINDNQIRDMLPLIYNSNPGMFGGYDYGLMQKMSEIYKYAQPGLMNPAMINPVMNAAPGAMSGSSGLQYEPPWQRQHQQQQQLRLQQLMQQQNAMGAKFYAGGLGSRDPVAMALQQQRAREIMMGGAGRPRGRPPLQPRAPAAPDVVNLDSD